MGKRAKNRYLYRGIWVVVLVGSAIPLASAAFPSPATADETAWSPELLDSGPAGYPVILADSEGRVHALWGHFFAETGDETMNAILYARREAGGSWTAPADILVAPEGGEVADLAAVMDLQKRIHLIWRGTEGLYYSSAQADEAGQARAWSAPRVLSRAQVGASSIASGLDGSLHVVYPDVSTSPGSVLFIKSTDGGATWGDPQTVSAPRHPAAQAINANLAVADSGRLHVVWTETIEEFPPSGVFYTHSDDLGKSWYEPQMMAGRGHSWISVGLGADDNQVHLIWTGTGDVRGKYHAASLDGGITWSNTEQVFPRGAGYLGFSRFAVDSGRVLHLVTALGRTSAQTYSGWVDRAWHSPGDIFQSAWQDAGWSQPEHVSVTIWEPQLEQHNPSVAISEGNLLHIVWDGTYHPEDAVRPVWYASRRLEAPRVLSATAVPTALPRPSPTARSSTPTAALGGITASPPGGVTPVPTEAPKTDQQAFWPLTSAILAAVLVVGSAVSWRLLKK